MLFAAAKLNQKVAESPKRRCHLFICALKGQFFQNFHAPATCNVLIQTEEKCFLVLIFTGIQFNVGMGLETHFSRT